MMMQRASPPVHILNNPDGSLCLISGSTKFTVSETPVSVNVKPEPTSPRCLTRARSKSKLKTETITPPIMSEKPSWPVRAQADTPSSLSKPLVRSVFICFFCKNEFTCRTNLIKHQDKCSAVPSGLRNTDSTADCQPSTTNSRHQPEKAAERPASETRSLMVADMTTNTCEKSIVSDMERRRSRSEAEVVLDTPLTSSEASGTSTSKSDSEVKPCSSSTNNPNPERVGRVSNSPQSVRPVAKGQERSRPVVNSPHCIRPSVRSPELRFLTPKLNSLPRVKVEPISPIRPGPKCSKPKHLSVSEVSDPPDMKEVTVQEIKQRPTVRRSLQGKPIISKERYTSCLALIPVTTVKDIEQEKHHNEIVQIDLTDETDVLAPKSPRTPATPRTLKSLLSFDSSQTQLNKTKETDEGAGEEEEGEEERSSDSEGEYKPRRAHHYHLPTNKTLLSIALSSNLGQKLRHLMDGAVERSHREKDYEQYCRTPLKSSFQDRLRYRDNSFPITFRKNKHHRGFYHVYKFTKKQREDFLKTVTTGLNGRSRKLYRSLAKSSVKLKRLTNRDIKRLSKVKTKQLARLPSFGEVRQWRQPNILRRIAPKYSTLAAALLRAPTRLETMPYMHRYTGPPRPVAMFQSYNKQNVVQPVINSNSILQQRQAGFSWQHPNPNRAVAQVLPMMKTSSAASPAPIQQARVTPVARVAANTSNRNKMVEEKIDDDISIVVPANDCITLSSSDSDDSPAQRNKRALINAAMPPPKMVRLHQPKSLNKSYSAPLTELPSPAKRVITAAAASADDNADNNIKTFLFRCHLCGLQERHRVSHSKDIYKHLHSNHRGEVIHIVDYKLHGEVHLVEAMSKPPTVMKTAPEVAKCSTQTTPLATTVALQAGNSGSSAPKPNPADVICLDD